MLISFLSAGVLFVVQFGFCTIQILLSVRPERGLSKRCLFVGRKIGSVLRQVHFGRVPKTQTTPLRVLPGVRFR